MKPTRDLMMLSQAKFGSLIGVTRSAIHQWEAGLEIPNEERRRQVKAIDKAYRSFLDKIAKDY